MERFVENCVDPHAQHLSDPSGWTSWLAKRGLAGGAESPLSRSGGPSASRGSSLTDSVFHVAPTGRNTHSPSCGGHQSFIARSSVSLSSMSSASTFVSALEPCSGFATVTSESGARRRRASSSTCRRGSGRLRGTLNDRTSVREQSGLGCHRGGRPCVDHTALGIAR